MMVHLVDGTYELFRYHFALPSHLTVGRWPRREAWPVRCSR